jgi:hypothetical protein
MRTARNVTLIAVAALAVLVALPVHAEEGGSGHYMPGGTASFVDALPAKPGLAVANYFVYYNGSASKDLHLPFGGLVAAHLDGTVYADTVLALYKTPFKLLDGYYTVGAAIPYVHVRIKGDVEIVRPGTTIVRTVRDTASGIGDITLYPFILGWTELGGDLKSDVRLGIYAPTGSYEKGRLANLGKNYWTFEPAVSLSYLGSKTGLELTAFAGVDVNTKNQKTDYQTGAQIHVDATVAQHLPLLGGAIGVGANGFYYQQVSSDSGSGARLGKFKGRTAGVGPVLSYATKISQADFVTEFKWLPEMTVKNRLDGDYIWLKVGVAF